MGKRLYVGNLPFDTDEAALRAAFGQDGRQVLNVHLVMDRETGRPRGFAFVEMNNDDDAKKAIVAMDGAEFSGRRLRVNEAEDRRPMGRGPGGPGGPGGPPRGPGGPGAARPGGGFGAPRPSYGAPAAGGDASRNFGPPALPASVEDKKKYAEKKNPKRRHDEDEDYGGRRGSRRFDDDDES